MAKYNEIELELTNGFKFIVREDSIAYAAEKSNEVCRGIANVVNQELKNLGLNEITVSVDVKSQNPEEELKIIGERINPDKEQIALAVINCVKSLSKDHIKNRPYYITVEV